jgi:hypothetical protein
VVDVDAPASAPPPVELADGAVAVAIDVLSLDATLHFDCAARVATAEATLRFRTGDSDGRPVFDLRQAIDEVEIDGRTVAAPHHDLGGGEGAEMRVADADLPAGTEHTLTVRYQLDTPATIDALPVGWTRSRPGVVFDLWMSDLHPGRYLEMWLPANLLHDRFALTLDVRVTGTDDDHVLLTNGTVEGTTITFPDRFTVISPMLVLAPSPRVELLERDGRTTATLAGPEVDLDQLDERTARWMDENEHRFGPYDHGDRFTTYIWASTRGMEYDGGTTASVGSLEHEVFHSWFGRGVKPAAARDGWIDEAFDVWCTTEREPRFRAQPFTDSSTPLATLCPPSPWSRHTPREAYTQGAAFFAGLADLMGADPLTEAMADLYHRRRGGFLSTADLQAHLSQAASRDLTPEFDRYVHGKPSS